MKGTNYENKIKNNNNKIKSIPQGERIQKNYQKTDLYKVLSL